MWFFRAVTLDPGTALTEDDQLTECGIAIKASRDELRMTLVTGRILDDLEGAFLGFLCEFDALVTENSAVPPGLEKRSPAQLTGTAAGAFTAATSVRVRGTGTLGSRSEHFALQFEGKSSRGSHTMKGMTRETLITPIAHYLGARVRQSILAHTTANDHVHS